MNLPIVGNNTADGMNLEYYKTFHFEIGRKCYNLLHCVPIYLIDYQYEAFSLGIHL